LIRKKLRLNGLDLGMILLLIGGGAYLTNTAFFAFTYQWNWSVIPQYFFRFDASADSWVPNLLVTGFLTTIRLSIWSSLLGLILGTIGAIVLRSGSLYLKLLGRSYVELVRNTPPLVLVFIFYFFFGNQIMARLNVAHFIATSSDSTQHLLSILFASKELFPEFLSAMLTLALYEGAYMTEILRAGLDAVPKGQWEAADSLGMNTVSKYRYVILPQAFRIILPALAGQFISTIKDSAIVSVISIQELTFQGMELMSATYLTFETWITITVMYFCLTFTCSLGAGRLERHLQKKQ
jgi:polar amino acid transport system permease protein